MEERWKDIKGYEDLFMISDQGNIWSKRSNKILKTITHKSGYVMFSTYIGGRKGKSVAFKVHRLVAEAFCENPLNKPCVNHIDANKANNRYENLEWVTYQENTKHAMELGLFQAPKHDKKLNDQDIEFIVTNYRPRDRELGARALARRFSVSHGTILEYVRQRAA